MPCLELSLARCDRVCDLSMSRDALPILPDFCGYLPAKHVAEDQKKHKLSRHHVLFPRLMCSEHAPNMLQYLQSKSFPQHTPKVQSPLYPPMIFCQGSQRSSKVRAMVLFPEPLGPRMAQRSPAWSLKSKSFTNVLGGGPSTSWDASEAIHNHSRIYLGVSMYNVSGYLVVFDPWKW